MDRDPALSCCNQRYRGRRSTGVACFAVVHLEHANQQIISWWAAASSSSRRRVGGLRFFHHDEGRQAPTSVTQSGTDRIGRQHHHQRRSASASMRRPGSRSPHVEQRIKGGHDARLRDGAPEESVAPLRVILASSATGVGGDDIASVSAKADELVGWAVARCVRPAEPVRRLAQALLSGATSMVRAASPPTGRRAELADVVAVRGGFSRREPQSIIYGSPTAAPRRSTPKRPA